MASELEEILGIPIDNQEKRQLVSMLEKFIEVRAGRVTGVPTWLQEEWSAYAPVNVEESSSHSDYLPKLLFLSVSDPVLKKMAEQADAGAKLVGLRLSKAIGFIEQVGVALSPSASFLWTEVGHWCSIKMCE